MRPLELWGGPECTVNRVGDRWRDQLRLSGHEDRASDLELFAELGLAAVRYPVLWERTAPDRDAAPDWRWPDARLARLRALNIRPIVGLVHHGSGPAHTDLLDDAFPAKLGRYAGQVAERYPWVESWTPVNEPVTTARFACLYGHWYPHAREEDAFWRALLNEVDATRAAMHAIRQVSPAARLIQTEDLGRTWATAPLCDQAAFDNLRRWAGWDLLFGRVTRDHPMWERLDGAGLGDRLRAIADDPCPPDVIGVNHYLTSERFLDHRLQRYPPHTHGDNGRMAYADIEALRVLDPPTPGLAGVLRETWARYRTPLAITEVHNGSTREEQLRWAAEAWDSAVALRGDGIPVEAVTAWALFGSQGWDTLLRADGARETGVFAITGPAPRPTALADLWRGLPGGALRHPVATEPGWWHRSTRLLYPALARPAPPPRATPRPNGRPLLICGATGTLGQAFARACTARGITHVLTGRRELDLADAGSIAAALDRHRPWGAINAAGWVRVDDAEDDEAGCRLANETGAVALARACAARGLACLNVSSDLVFDGAATRPYVESDRPDPLNAYGRSKAAMEAGCAGLPGSLVVRTAAFFSPFDRYNFAVAVAETLAGGQRFTAARDCVITPSFVPALVDASLDLLIDGAEGVWHLAGDEPVSWAEFARRVAGACGLDPGLILPVDGAELGWRAPRPRYAALGSERGVGLGPLDAALAPFAAAFRGDQRRAA